MGRLTRVALLALALVPGSSHAQTALVRDINPAGTSRNWTDLLVGAEDAIVFSADDGTTGPALWRTDGTMAGTTLLADLFGGGGFFPVPRTAVGVGPLTFFIVADGFTGEQLWRSDGTVAGTFRLTTPATAADHVDQIVGLERFRTGVAFKYNERLWLSNGTVAGTAEAPAQVTMSNLPIANVDGVLITTGSFPGAGGSGIVRTDGSVAGTQLLEAGGVFLPKAVNGRLFFQASFAATGSELHALDAGASATRLVKDIVPGFVASDPRHFTRVDDRLFFTASEPAAGEELWVSDGTDAGTYRVKDIVPGPNSSNPTALVAFGSKLYFAATTPENGTELWQSDGTDAGTTMVVDLNPGTETGLTGAVPYDSPGAIAAVNGRIFFQGRPDHFGFGARLWMLDAAGLLAQPVDESTLSVGALLPLNGKLLFTGSRTSGGMEPYSADLLALAGRTWCVAPEAPIPDDGSAARFAMLLPDVGETLLSPVVSVDLGHTQVGELHVVLAHRETGTSVNLIKYPGTEFLPGSCASDLIDIRFTDAASTSANTSCAVADQRLAYPRDADYAPITALALLAAESVAGHWDLLVNDAAAGHAGTLHQWCLSWSAPTIFGDGFEDPW
jgi:ELWxxDGT repeat protein